MDIYKWGEKPDMARQRSTMQLVNPSIDSKFDCCELAMYCTAGVHRELLAQHIAGYKVESPWLSYAFHTRVSEYTIMIV
jgi:hypothetical protein